VSVLRFDRVGYSYPGAREPALREVSLAIEPGEFCVLAGLSGSGKSTLLRAAAGLVPHFHGGTFAGAVTVGGLDTREHSPAEVGRLAGTLLQDPETQVIMSSVRSELALALENAGRGDAAVARAIEEAALALGLRRRAAARRARSRARRAPAARAARRADLPARPGRRR
jgi:energy-coupling factor transporter ATP-binding protein EcfA2